MLSNKEEKHFQALLEKYELGEATPAEQDFIESWFNYLDEMNKEADPFAGMQPPEKLQLRQQMHERLLHEMQESTTIRTIRPARRASIKWQAAAAVLFIICAAGGYWFFFRNTEQTGTSVAVTSTDTIPARERAVLKLASGEEILLDSAHGRISSQQFNASNDSGRLQYGLNNKAPEYHTLSTPRGAQYQLQLPDGTEVWMNAASSITYPTAFTGSHREVTITGEAYLEVARNKDLPFRVKAGGMLIDVTGTHFNINTYTNEPILTTTLLEGGVNVSSNSSKVMLHPGEQSQLNAEGQLSVKKDVNTGEIIAWKNGQFHFESADLETILRQLSRWYDVDVHYEGLIPNEQFFMIIKRTSSLSAVLKALQANNVQFSIEGKKLTVKARQ